ncbi:MAG: hydrogenase maturation nickel metallochaperone HypA [Acidobacteria bacterium]|nr:hydrogenase maturation nickel metallochaperone HypA [Acidobacteriota bacterium]
MHELGIAQAVLEAVQKEVVRYPSARPVKVGLRIGELSGVDSEALGFALEAIVQGTEWRQVQFAIEFCPRRHQCEDCSREFVIVNYDLQCPHCGGRNSHCIGGEELELAFVEVEEHAASRSGTEGVERKCAHRGGAAPTFS